MKTNIKIAVISLIAIGLGITIGYLLFSPSKSEVPKTDHSAHESDIIAVEEIWTCAMHPQIRQSEFGLCPICEMDLVLLEANTSSNPLVLEMTDEALKMANIQTSIVGSEKIESSRTLRLSGKVQADERLASIQVAHVSGRIEKLYVAFTGEQIRRGQKLADIYSPELVTAQQELLEAFKLKDLNPGLAEAARKKLRNWKVSNDFIDKIESSGKISETFTVYADVSGIVTQKRVSVGDYLSRGEALFDVANLEKVWILLDAYESDLHNISLGDKIEFSTSANPNINYSSKITFIDPAVNPKTRVVSIRAEVQNKKGVLKPEMLVHGILSLQDKKNQLLYIPKSAVLWTGTRSVVYVKLADMEVPSFEYKEIELGEAIGDQYQVASGLEVGEEIVTYGSFSIDAAAQLSNQASMMNKHVFPKEEEMEVQVPDYREGTPSLFNNQLTLAVTKYLEMKDALVNTDAASSKEIANQLATILKRIDGSILDKEMLAFWTIQYEALSSYNNSISESLSIEDQRKEFYFLSNEFIRTIKAFGVQQETFYIQHCPMANNDNGGDWISREKEIRNPYFGDKMMKCGYILDTIQRADF